MDRGRGERDIGDSEKFSRKLTHGPEYCRKRKPQIKLKGLSGEISEGSTIGSNDPY